MPLRTDVEMLSSSLKSSRCGHGNRNEKQEGQVHDDKKLTTTPDETAAVLAARLSSSHHGRSSMDDSLEKAEPEEDEETSVLLRGRLDQTYPIVSNNEINKFPPHRPLVDVTKVSKKRVSSASSSSSSGNSSSSSVSFKNPFPLFPNPPATSTNNNNHSSNPTRVSNPGSSIVNNKRNDVRSFDSLARSTDTTSTPFFMPGSVISAATASQLLGQELPTGTPTSTTHRAAAPYVGDDNFSRGMMSSHNCQEHHPASHHPAVDPVYYDGSYYPQTKQQKYPKITTAHSIRPTPITVAKNEKHHHHHQYHHLHHHQLLLLQPPNEQLWINSRSDSTISTEPTNNYHQPPHLYCSKTKE
jgi:hypothetical protein